MDVLLNVNKGAESVGVSKSTVDPTTEIIEVNNVLL